MAEKPRKSKRHTLSRLDASWREKIFASLQSERLKLAVAVLSSSGCRPSELERGVLIKVRDEHLQIGIHGSKVDASTGRGQPLRLLVVDSDTPWGAYLKDRVERETSRTIRVTYDAGGISQRLREKSREIWPRRSTLISAYSFRHFVGKSMKESGEPMEMIAQVLGHASDFSQTVYGRAGAGKKCAGQHGIVTAIASNPIRHSHKTDRLDRFYKTKPAALAKNSA